MSKPFDATLKQLVDSFAADWIGALAPLVGLPADTTVEPLDADLSTISPAVDKLFRIHAPGTGLLHIEVQANWDGGFPDRLLFYNIVVDHRYGGPVYTIAVLLRREADASNLTGRVTRTNPDGTEYLRFEYKTIRLWELSSEQLFNAGLGTIPLALLTDDAGPRLQEMVTRFADRAENESPDRDTSDFLLMCGFILLGLRYDKDTIRRLFSGVQRMTESSTYQFILDEGRAEGIAQGIAQSVAQGVVQGQNLGLIKGEQTAVLQERFGSVPPEVEERIRANTDPTRLQTAIRQSIRIAAPTDLQI